MSTTKVFILNDSNEWIETDAFEFVKINKTQNGVSEFEIKLMDVTDDIKAYVKEFTQILMLSNGKVMLKGRIQSIDYGSDYETTIHGFGMEAKLLEKEFVKDGDKRYDYVETSAKDIAIELLGIAGMSYVNAGLFATDYGNINIRFEYENILNCLGALANAIGYKWWISHSADYKTDYFNMSLKQGVDLNIREAVKLVDSVSVSK